MISINETDQKLIHGDSRDLSFLPNESVHLVVTSPPYWNLKRYNENSDQLGHIDDYETFLKEEIHLPAVTMNACQIFRR